MNDKDYQNYVDLAKKEIKQIEGHQIRICEYAEKVCTIRHGGRSNGYYTLTDFANDIGLPVKTLQNWMLTYRNVIKKLDKTLTTSKEFHQAQKVESYLREARTAQNRLEGKPVGSKHAIRNSEFSPEKIKNIYNSINNGEKPFQSEFCNLQRSAQHIKGVLQKRDLGIISDKELLYLMQLLDDSSDIINNFLTKKQKLKGRAA